MAPSEDWITVNKAAALANYHVQTIRELLREGKIEGRKFGTTWMVSRESLQAYVQKMGQLGERRGPKPGKTNSSFLD